MTLRDAGRAGRTEFKWSVYKMIQPAASPPTRVTQRDLEALIRLAGEAGEIGRDIRRRRAHVLEGLARLCHADKAVFAPFMRSRSDPLRWEVCRPDVVFINTDPDELRRMRHFYEHGEPVDPVIDRMANVEGEVIVATPLHYMTDEAWRRTAHYNEVRRPARIEQQVYARYGNGPMQRIGVGLQRRRNVPFGQRELELASIFLRNAGHLIEDSAEPVSALRLPPRLKPVLERYLAGDSEKEAAAALGLSPQTVHTYAKQLYRAIGVSSRAELMAKFIMP